MARAPKEVNGIAGKELKSAAKELSEFMDKPIQVTGKSLEFIAACVVKAHEALEEGDELTPGTIDIVMALKGEDEEAPEEAPEDLTNLDKASLSKVVKDMNKAMNIDNPIDIKKASIQELKDEIISLAAEIKPEEDEKGDFSKLTIEIIEKLGVEIDWEKEEEKPKASPKKKPAGKSNTKETIESFISPGKFTRKEIMEKVSNKLPNISSSTISTFLSDGKNPKYNKFDKLIKVGKNDILSF